MDKNICKCKCAPSKKYENNSCISTATLINMAYAFNRKYGNNMINIPEENITESHIRMSILDQFKDKFKNKCNNELCWKKDNFVSFMDEKFRDDLLNNTHKPFGPSAKYEWLNTLHINNVMSQYEDVYDNFLFLGAVPIDFDDIPVGIRDLDIDDVYKNGKTKIGVIFNLDEHYKSGSHWVGSFFDLDKGNLIYYDSTGVYPKDEVVNLFKRMRDFCIDKLNIKDVKSLYNKRQHQHGTSECGVYSIAFIMNMLKHGNYINYFKNTCPDEIINKCRNKYFILN